MPDQPIVQRTPLIWIQTCAGLPSIRPRAASPPTGADREHAGQDGAHDAADAVNAEHVQRIVVADHVLEAVAAQ